MTSRRRRSVRINWMPGPRRSVLLLFQHCPAGSRRRLHCGPVVIAGHGFDAGIIRQSGGAHPRLNGCPLQHHGRVGVRRASRHSARQNQQPSHYFAPPMVIHLTGIRVPAGAVPAIEIPEFSPCRGKRIGIRSPFSGRMCVQSRTASNGILTPRTSTVRSFRTSTAPPMWPSRSAIGASLPARAHPAQRSTRAILGSPAATVDPLAGSSG